jgi:hypothetical protein
VGEDATLTEAPVLDVDVGVVEPLLVVVAGVSFLATGGAFVVNVTPSGLYSTP